VIDRVTRRVGSSYRLRLTLGYVAVTAVLALAWAVSLFGPLTSAITSQQRSQLESLARADALALAYADSPAASLARRLGSPDLRVTVVGADGTVLADNQNDLSKMENHLTRPEIASALAGRVGHDVRRSRTEGIDQLYVAVPATYLGRPVALRVSESLASVSALASQARRTGLLLLLAAIAVAGLFTARLASMTAAPVSRLADAAHAIARGDSRDVRQEAGDLGVVSEALTDLAEQVRGRIAQSEAEQANLRAVLDGLDDAVLLLDGDVVRLANGAASRLFRAPFGGWRGKRLDETDLPASLLAAVRDTRADATGQPAFREFNLGPSGRRLRLTVAPLNATDAASRTLVVIADVTERACLDAMRRDFVANASHELKTPTAAIQLLAGSARTAAADGDVTQALAFVSQIEAEADRMRRLVLDLLDLSRLESVPAEGAVTDLRSAVSLALTAHRPAADAKGLTLRADFSAVSSEDVFACADATDVAVALDNLLSNAVGYTESGGVTVSLAADADSAVLTVSDTGVGIPQEALPRVFERFYRVDRARSRESGGTGLGLALVRHVVERSCGEVTIASTLCEGTTVTLRLPRAI
jgi:two-component system phosphate regulon sensor histidine kinase PhoR